MSALVVIHDANDPLAGSRWSGLRSVWDGEVLAPDLPGHGRALPPVGGAYAPGDAALVADRALREAGLAGSPVVALGHGWGGFGAELLAAGGRVSAVVLVDGLGGPWAEPAEIVDATRRWLHALLDDLPSLLPPATSPDPRLRHGFPTVWERAFTEARRAAIAVPVLAVETGSSPTPSGDAPERLRAFAGPTALVHVDTLGEVPAAVAAHAGFLTSP